MEAFPTGRFPSSWKLSPQLAQSDEVATASGGEKCWTITRAAEPARKDRAKRRGTPAVVEKVFDRRAIFRAKRGNMRREFFLQCWKRKNGKFHEEKTSRVFFYRYMRK